MSLTAGSTIGSYRVLSKLGEGGMGEVYRATDVRLGRDVALKVLPNDVAGNPDRLARFEREAKALAALNHFNIAQVYGFEGRALVMELLEGETLRERLAGGALPVRKAIEYATQMARGLAAAHDRGIIHRDLKPENVFVLKDGHIKILDFGLARHVEEDSAIETVTAGTAPGTVLGTAGYMSPEQVRGQPVDARSDVFSLGAVLYEMLTGTRAFRRDSSADTMSAILNEHPRDITAERPDVSPALDRIVQHCLEKNRLERFQSARDIAFALDSLSGSVTSPPTVAATTRTWPVERVAWGVVTVALIAALAWSWLGGRTAPPTPAAVTRAQLILPEGVAINTIAVPGSRLMISPDGSRLLFQGRAVSSGQSQLFLMSLDGGAVTALPGTESAANPFWSPDSREIAFSFNGTLMRLSLDGGYPLQVAKDATSWVMSGAWGADGVMLLAGPRLQQVMVADGSLTTALEGNGGYVFPHFLPDGRRFVFGVADPSGDVMAGLGRIGSSETHELLRGKDVGKALYANGALLFMRGSTLFAQAVSDDEAALAGEPVAIAGPIEASPMRGGAFSVSDNGVLVYQAASRQALRLTWVDRRGNPVGVVGDDADYSNVELDPAARRALVTISDPRLQTRDLFVVDLERGIRQRLTIDPSDERSAVWSPDGTRVIYSSKGLDLYVRNADSSGAEQPLIMDDATKDPYDWSADGTVVIYRRTGNGTGNDIWIAPADGSSPGRMLAGTSYSEVPGGLSPDGRFLVYTSDESGQNEVYVMNVAAGGKTRISTNGGVFPLWRGDGREIVFVTPDQALMSAAVETGAEFTVSTPARLFQTTVPVTGGRMYDISRDGQRVLIATPVPSRVPPAFTVVTNWTRLLGAK